MTNIDNLKEELSSAKLSLAILENNDCHYGKNTAYKDDLRAARDRINKITREIAEASECLI